MTMIEIRDAWTAVHAPRMEPTRDRPPKTSWWLPDETPPDEFYERARREFHTRTRYSMRTTGQKGIPD